MGPTLGEFSTSLTIFFLARNLRYLLCKDRILKIIFIFIIYDTHGQKSKTNYTITESTAIINIIAKLQQGGPTTNKLQRVNIVIADQGYCANIYNKMGYHVYDTQVCAYDPQVEKGSCHVSSPQNFNIYFIHTFIYI